MPELPLCEICKQPIYESQNWVVLDNAPEQGGGFGAPMTSQKKAHASCYEAKALGAKA
jgi:hypothetical protein